MDYVEMPSREPIWERRRTGPMIQTRRQVAYVEHILMRRCLSSELEGQNQARVLTQGNREPSLEVAP